MTERVRWNPRRKLEIVLEGLVSNTVVAEVCRQNGISITQYYTWKKQLFNGAEAIFQHRRKDSREQEIQRLQEELRRKDEVIAEITQENLTLKKNTWGLEEYLQILLALRSTSTRR